MYAPYLLTNIYVRGAYAEAAAQAILPWIFWSFRRLLRGAEPSAYLLPAALSLGALAVTHNVTLVFLPAALLIYMAIHWRLGGGGRARFGWAGLAMALAMGISAFFWLPVLLEQRYIVDTISGIGRFAAPWPVTAWRWSNFLDRTFVFELCYYRAVSARAGSGGVGDSRLRVSPASRRRMDILCRPGRRGRGAD